MKLHILFLLMTSTITTVTSSRFERALVQIRELLDGNDVSTYDTSCGRGDNMTQPQFDYPDEDGHVGGAKPQVQTSSGVLSGARLPQGNAFFNIPYAIPPLAEKRFTRPQPLTDAEGNELDVSIKRMIACYQHCQYKDGAVFKNYTEDCLTLSVHTPTYVNLNDSATPPSERLPVLVWFYGGGFMTGSANFPIYDGRFLSNASDLIVVGVNYRLGIFGFLAFNENGEEVKGNQGFKDQQLALKWVQDNIEKFGGDKNQVAIAGQSAGAQSVMFHLMSAESKPLFQRAILQSNPAMFKYQTLDEALGLLPQLLKFTGCTEGGVACLRTTEPHQLVKASYSLEPYYFEQHDIVSFIEPMKVILDGVEFTTDPVQVFKDGSWDTDKEVIMGTTMDEIYVPPYFPMTMPKALYERLVKYVLGEELGQVVSDMYGDLYAEGTIPNKDYRIPLGKIISDSFFKCPVRMMARSASKTATGNNIYLYSYTHTNMGSSCNESDVAYSCGTATHSSENSLLFRTFDFVNYNPTDEDWLVSDQIGFYWSNMAKSGNPSPDPNNEEFVTWPPYTDQANTIAGNMERILNRRRSRLAESPWTNVIIDSPRLQLETNYMQDLCDFWDTTGYNFNATTSSTDDVTTSAMTTSGVDDVVTTTPGVVTTTTLGGVDTTSSSAGLKMSFVILWLSCLMSLFL